MQCNCVSIQHNLLDIQQFIENPHPYMLPNFIDLFEWSIPFIAQKVTALMDHLIKPNREYD
jgi:serine/threonine-protein phosphatase 2B catalytic subunit